MPKLDSSSPVLIGTALIVLSAIVWYWTMTPHGSSPPPVSTPAVSKTDPAYPNSVLGYERSPINGDEMLVFAMKLQGSGDGSADMLSVTSDMKTILQRELKAGISDQYVDFHILGKSASGLPREMNLGNDYGHSELFNAFDIWYTTDDVKKIDFDHLSSSTLLNLGHVDWVYPLGTDISNSYCQKNREYADVFCANRRWKIWQDSSDEPAAAPKYTPQTAGQLIVNAIDSGKLTLTDYARNLGFSFEGTNGHAVVVGMVYGKDPNDAIYAPQSHACSGPSPMSAESVILASRNRFSTTLTYCVNLDDGHIEYNNGASKDLSKLADD